jgi:glycosyltransferase involved in cell wall biosynthesis
MRPDAEVRHQNAGPEAPRSKPVALVTNVVTDYRVEPFRMLDEAEGVEVLAFRDGQTTQLGAARRVASGRYRAVVCGLGGRVALPATYLAARRAGIPFVLWASIWSHPRTPAHLLSYLPTRALYRRADAVVTYGPHVTRYVVERRGRDDGVFEAPQAVSAEHFGRALPAEAVAAAREGAGDGDFLALFVGRLEREKGVELLLDAWGRADLGDGAALAFAGEGPLRGAVERAGGRALGRVPRSELPALYAAADTLVLPSIRTATFVEPWGLVVNEAMHQGTPILASDAVGAVAGGLVRDGRNGLVAPAGDADALAARIRSLAENPELRERLGRAAREDVGGFTYRAWVEGVRQALRSVGTSRGT